MVSNRRSGVAWLAIGSVSADSQAAPARQLPPDPVIPGRECPGWDRPESSENQDRWVALTDAEAAVLAVADGMGGIPGGGAAATRALAGMLSLIGDGLAADSVRPDSVRPDSVGPAELLAGAVAAADRRVRALAERVGDRPDPRGPGSTFTAALILGDRLHLAHVGDSSCWLFRRGRLCRLTEQHTAAAVLVASGAVAASSMAARRLDALLTRYLGMPGVLHPQLTEIRLRPGDRLLLATDGLTRSLAVSHLAVLLRDPRTTADRLVAAAVAAGARDDVTAVVAAVRSTHGIGSQANTQYPHGAGGTAGTAMVRLPLPPFAPEELPTGETGRAAVAGR